MGFLRKVLGGAQQGAGAPGPSLGVDDFLGDEAARSLAAGIDADGGAAFRAYLAAEPDLERRDAGERLGAEPRDPLPPSA